MTTMTMKTETGVRAESDEWGTSYRRTDNCENHGPFESSGYLLNSSAAAGKPICWISCPTCSEEREEKRKHQEQKQQEQKLLQARLDRSGIPYRFHDAELENYNATDTGQKRALEIANNYAHSFQDTFDQGQSLLLLGKVGTGKTHLAVGIAHKAMKQGFSAIFTTTADMIGKVKATWGQRGSDSESEGTIINRFATVALLVIDEVGSFKCAGREWEILFSILGKRHNEALPTVFTANLKPEELSAYLGDQIVSRLREDGSQRVIFGWGDYRLIKGEQAIADRNATKAKKSRDAVIETDPNPDAGKPKWETVKEMTP